MHFGKINSRERNDAVVLQACSKAVRGGSSLALQASEKAEGNCRSGCRCWEFSGVSWVGVSSCGRGCAERVCVRLNKPLNLSNVFLALLDGPCALQMGRDGQMHISVMLDWP